MRSLLFATTLVVLLAAIYLHRGERVERDTKLDAKQNKFFYNNGDFPDTEAYLQLLRELRNRLASGDNKHGIPLLPPHTSVPLGERFIEVQLENGDNGDVITVIIDTVNVYVVAYFETRTRSGLLPTLHYLNDPRVEKELFMAFPSPIYTHHELHFSGNYNHLPNRETQEIGHGALNDAIRNLYEGRSHENALLVIIQMVAEAVRIRFIEYRIRQNMRKNQNFIPDTMVISVENKWSKLCEQVQWSGDFGVFPTSIEIQDLYNHVVPIADVSSLVEQIGVALLLYTATCNPSAVMRIPPVVAVGADEDEQCPYAEPTTNIIGRDELCVDVEGNQYHNGNAIMLYACGNAKRNQLWTFKSDGTIRSNGKCLTTYGYTSGNYIMIFDCDTAVPEATQWVLYDGGSIMNPKSGLVIEAETSTQGTVLTVAEDNNSSRQAWSAENYIFPTIKYILGLNEMCLQANGFNARVWLADCVFGTKLTQMWTLYGDRTIRLFSEPNLCVTSDGNNSRDSIILLVCQGSANQRWTFMADGTILNPNAQLVMDVRGGDVSLQDIILYRPTGRSNQEWMTMF